jgi:glutathione synthase/RimK-type ligase-like ATP-grasp enzyme
MKQKKVSLKSTSAPKPKLKKKKFTRFRAKILSRHPTHKPLRSQLALLPFRSVVRLGSTTNVADSVSNGGKRVECNTIQAVKTSANKLLMKHAFSTGNVRTAKWHVADALFTSGVEDKSEFLSIGDKKIFFPIVTKSHMGSRGRGNALHKTIADFNKWAQGKTLSNYIIEEFHDFNREYRLHVTSEGVFYTCRKMLKQDTPEDKRWFRNDSNSTWIKEENPQFDKPTNWTDIVSECVKALKAVGLDVGACDVKVQSAKDKKGNVRQNPEFIIIEINSAPSFGDVTLQKYLVELPKILTRKATKH